MSDSFVFVSFDFPRDPFGEVSGEGRINQYFRAAQSVDFSQQFCSVVVDITHATQVQAEFLRTMVDLDCLPRVMALLHPWSDDFSFEPHGHRVFCRFHRNSQHNFTDALCEPRHAGKCPGTRSPECLRKDLGWASKLKSGRFVTRVAELNDETLFRHRG